MTVLYYIKRVLKLLYWWIKLLYRSSKLLYWMLKLLYGGSKLLYWPIASKVTFVPHGLAISLLLFIEHQVYFRLGAWGPEMSFWMVGSLGCVQLSISSGAPLTPYTMHHHLSPGETIDMCVYISHHVILACSKCMGWAHVQSAHMHFVFSISFFPINKLNWYWLLP